MSVVNKDIEDLKMKIKFLEIRYTAWDEKHAGWNWEQIKQYYGEKPVDLKLYQYKNSILKHKKKKKD